MNDLWTQSLEDQGISIGPDGFSHAGTEDVDVFQKLSGDTICDISHTSRVVVRGADAADFLQNQLTNDLRGLEDDRAVLAGYCNAKGRLICVFRIERLADGFLLELPTDVRDTALQTLQKYVLRARVEFDTGSDDVAFGICGKTVAKRLEQIAGALPRREGELIRHGDLELLRLAGAGRPRFRVTGPARAGIAAWDKLKQHAVIMGSWAWARRDILAGIPNISAAVSGSFIPQMVNLDLLGGVNFQKGCYPGQEVVARMHYLGNLKQRMARFRVDDDQRPAPGERVYTPGSASPTGTVVDGQHGAGAGWDLLAVVRLADLDKPALSLRSDHGPALFRQDLPYELDAPA